MKKMIKIIMVICTIWLSPVITSAQVFIDFEVEALGTEGFVDNGWGTGFSSVSWLADPTGNSVGVMALDVDIASSGDKGVIELCCNIDALDADVISFNIYLPTSFPDSATVTIWSQDNSSWAWGALNTYYGVDLAKGVWIPLNFDMRYFNADTNFTYDPYFPNQIGKLGLEIAYWAGAYTGQVLVDDLTRIGIQPETFANFEVEALGTEGFVDNAWGTGFSSVFWLADPTGNSVGVMALNVDIASSGDKGVIELCCNIDALDADVISFNIYLPTSFPDSATVTIWSQDNSSWAWGALNTYYGVDLAKGVWIPLNFDMRYFNADTNYTFDPYAPNQIGKIGIEIAYWAGAYTGQVLVDDIQYLSTAIGAEWAIADFEAEGLGAQGWDSGWGDARVGTPARINDPTDLSDGVLEMVCDAAQGDHKAAFANEGITVIVDNAETGVPDTATALTFDVYLPAGFPTETWLSVFGQDRVSWAWNTDGYSAADLIEGWNTVSFDIQSRIDTIPSYDVSNGIKAGIEFYFGDVVTFTGSVFIDNITLEGVSKPEGTLASPVIWSTTHVDSVSPYGKHLHYNEILWVDLDTDLSETYTIYRSEQLITDVNAEGIIKLDYSMPRGGGKYRDQIYSYDGSVITYYYALTSTGLDPDGNVVETSDAPSTTDALTGGTTLPLVIPLVDSFTLTLDGEIDEFRALDTDFPDAKMVPETIHWDYTEGTWDIDSEDLNFEMYMVISDGYLFVGVEVIDDDPTGPGQAWEGDGFDIYTGFYDIAALTENHPKTALSDATFGDYRISYGINDVSGCKFQRNGYQCWEDLSGLEHQTTNYGDSYVVEFKFPLASLTDGPEFTPEHGMFIPLKLDFNDYDIDDPLWPGTGHQRTLQCHTGSIGNSESWLRPGTWGWAVISDGTSFVGINDEGPLPLVFSLSPNYPNPFNPVTTINYSLRNDEFVNLTVYNILGEYVTTLVNEPVVKGYHYVQWNGTNRAGEMIGSGVYFYRIEAGNYVEVRKLTLLK